jgi:hypothetical protein
MGSRTKLSDADEQAIRDMKYWQSFERDGWKCLGFTYRDAATFVKGNATIEVRRGHFELFDIEH